MKIIEILKEQGPEGGPQTPIGTKKPTGSATAPVKRKTPINPFGAIAVTAGQQMLNKADTAAQDRVGPGDQDMAVGAEERFNKSAGTTITTGRLDPNLEQSGKDYANELKGTLAKAQRSMPKGNQVQDRANK